MISATLKNVYLCTQTEAPYALLDFVMDKNSVSDREVRGNAALSVNTSASNDAYEGCAVQFWSPTRRQACWFIWKPRGVSMEISAFVKWTPMGPIRDIFPDLPIQDLFFTTSLGIVAISWSKLVNEGLFGLADQSVLSDGARPGVDTRSLLSDPGVDDED